MKLQNKNMLLIGIFLLLLTLFLIYKTYEGFQNTDCTSITDCKTCSVTMGCTFCSNASKCVNSVNQYSACPNDTYLNSPDDCIDCSKVTDCKTCAGLNPCAWCKSSNKCVSSSNTSTLCPGESTSVDPNSCALTNYDISGVDASGFNVSDSISALQDQLDSGVYDSNNPIQLSTQSPNSSSSFEYADISLQYPGTSIIPILGLSRDINGHLTQASLKSIVQSAKNSGYVLNTSNDKQKLLDDVAKESNFYITTKKSYMKKYLDNSVEYVDDSDSLKHIQELDTKIMDLNDISGFIKGLNVSGFTEGYSNKDEKDIFNNDTLLKNNAISGYLQFLWIVNLVGIGTFLYFLNRK